jgi:hypothetical protein
VTDPLKILRFFLRFKVYGFDFAFGGGFVALRFLSLAVPSPSLRHPFLPLEPPSHALMPDIDRVTKHERAASNDAFHSKTFALADSLFRDAAFAKRPVKPDLRHATLFALANDRG